MNWAHLAAVLNVPAPISVSGSFDATATAGQATSSTRTITVPAGNSGQIQFDSFVDVGTILSIQYSKNGGAFTAFAENDIIAFANGDTLAIRTTGNGAGESRVFRMLDVTRSATIGTYTHTGA